MTSIFLLPVTPTYSHNDEQLLTFLPSRRAERLRRYVQESDRKNCLYSYLLARYCISHYIHLDEDALSFTLDAMNKPILQSHPEVHFNISHTKGFICCIVSDSPCGIDVEATTNQPPEILDIAFTKAEQKYIRNFIDSSSLYPAHFYKIWTLKEAYTKALGIGLLTDMKEINTFDEHFVSNAVTFSSGDYIISGYTTQIRPYTVSTIEEPYLYQYFRERSS